MQVIEREYYKNEPQGGRVNRPEDADFMVEKVLLNQSEMRERYPELFETPELLTLLQ